MLRSIASVGLGLTVFASPLMSVQAQDTSSCRALASSLQVRQVEAIEMTEARDAMKVDVEAAGEAWEAAEELRHFSADHAADADAKQAVFRDLESDFYMKQMGLQAKVEEINASVARYNSSCTRKSS